MKPVAHGARRQVLERLLAGNHARVAAEAAKPTPKPKRGHKEREADNPATLSLFPQEF